MYLFSVRHFYAHSHRLYCAHSIGCIRMNNFAAEVTRLLCSLISTQLQQNLPRYLEVLKLQKEFEETCTSPGRYYICGGTGKEEEKIINYWKNKWNEKNCEKKCGGTGKKVKDEIINAWGNIYKHKKWEIQDLRVMKSGLGLVGKHSV